MVAKGDRVRTAKGDGVVQTVGGKPSGLPHPDFPDWIQAQLVVVRLDGAALPQVFTVDEVSELSGQP